MRRFARRRAIAIGSTVTVVAGLLGAVMVTQASAQSRPPAAGAVVPGHVTPDAALARADAAIRANPAALALSPDDSLKQFRTMVDDDGSSHVRYTRTYKGLRVYGGDVVVHNRADGSFGGASVGLTAPLNLDTKPTITPEAAAAAARRQFTGSLSAPASSSAGARAGARAADVSYAIAFGVGTPELIIDASKGTGVLAYETVVSGLAKDGKTPSRLHVLVNANSGAILGSFDEIDTVSGTGNTIYSGSVPLDVTQYGPPQFPDVFFSLEDPVRGGATVLDAVNTEGQFLFFIDNDTTTFGTGSNSDPQSAGADAHYGAALTYDYYKNTFGRNGVYGDGSGVISIVHFSNNYSNAFWDSGFMVYGDGPGNASPLTAIDVAGHEMTHGYTENLVPGGLTYESESGGLNEATSDIFASMIEFYANNPNDPADYLIGEELGIFGPALRYMYNPALDGLSYSCWDGTAASADVHLSSGIGNHFFFMLAEGSGSTAFGTSPVCGGAPAVTGIGRTKASAIWYRALSTYFTSSTSYVNAANPANTARSYTLSAAGDLYGVCSTEYKAVQAAWTAVNVAGADGVCPTAAGAFVSVAPARVLDTRVGNGVPFPGKVPAAGTIDLQITGRGGVPPTGVGAVVLNVTVTETSGPGFITAYPTGEARPLASNLNFTGGQTIPNLVTVKLGTGGKVSLYNGSGGSTHIIADVAGFYLAGTPTDPGTFAPITPARLLDTRDGTGVPAAGKVGSNGAIDLQVTGEGGVPETGVGAVVLNVTVTEPTGPGFITAYPTGETKPLASNLNFTANKTIPNLVTVKVGDDGQVTLFNGSPGSTHLIADVAGYYLAGTPTLPGTFVPLAPARLLDTRIFPGKVGSNGTVGVQVLGQGGVPASGAGAAVLNVTVTEPTSAGFITAYPSGFPRPLASNLNFTSGLTIPNLTIVKLGTGGAVSLFNGSAGSSHLIADVAGYFLS